VIPTNVAFLLVTPLSTLGVILTPLNLYKYSNNFALGSTLKPNSTLFVQYRIGGGTGINLGVGVITQIGTVSFFVNGPSESVNTTVVNSLRCNNITAAIGGANYPTTEEVRNLVSYNFTAQNRAVTVNDYESIIDRKSTRLNSSHR
jgi:hypothetical protein